MGRNTCHGHMAAHPISPLWLRTTSIMAGSPTMHAQGTIPRYLISSKRHGTPRDGKLFGRSIVDMKGLVAIALAQAPTFLERGLRTPIHCALSYDEEVGCLMPPRSFGSSVANRFALRPASS